MAYTQFDPERPSPSAPDWQADLDATRANLLALNDGVIISDMPGWAYSVEEGTNDRPTKIHKTKGTTILRKNIEWGTDGGEAGNPKTIDYHFSDDAGSSWDFIGRKTITWDEDGNVASTSWSLS